MSTINDTQHSEGQVQDGRRNNRGGARPGAGRKTKAEEGRAELRRMLLTAQQPDIETPKPRLRVERPKAQDGRRNNGGARLGAGRKRKSAEPKPNKYAPLTAEEKSEIGRLLLNSAAGTEAEPTVRAQKSGGKGRVGRHTKFTDAEGLAAVVALGPRLSVSQLAKALDCARPTVNDWVSRMGFKSLEALAEAHFVTLKGV